ncbi:MAG: efflux RND transporter permease subunit [Pseudomonadota bacterium]
MNLSLAALKQQPLLFFLFAILMLFGAFSYFNLPAREDPKLTIRAATVTTSYPGLSAEQVELLITKPLEEAIVGLEYVKEVKSTSIDGFSIITPEFTWQTEDLEETFGDLAETVQRASAGLPEGASTPVVNDDFGDIAVMSIALFGKDYSNAELADFAQHTRDQLLTVPGTKRVDILGVREQRMMLEYSNAELAQLGISPEQIAAALRTENIIQPAGTIDIGATSMAVRPSGNFQSIDDVRSTMIIANDGTMLRVADVAEVSHGYQDPPGPVAYYNGQEAIVLAVSMEDGLSVLSYSDAATERMDAIAATYPVGLGYDLVTYEAPKVEAAVYGVSFNILQSLIILLAIVILFLGVRTGLVVGAIVPAVILASFAVMGLFQIPLQRMSLATIIISLGLLVDNGIVIAEDFKRRVLEVGDRMEALKQTSKELAFPLLSSSMTTMAVFLPLLIANTDSTEYTRTISLVIIITLSISWIFAMTITTTLCHNFLKVPEAGPDGEVRDPDEDRKVAQIFNRLTDFYERGLRRILKNRWKYVGAMVVLFMFGGFLQSQIPQLFFPDNDNPQVLVYVELPAGVSSQATDERVREMAEIVADKEAFPEIQNFVSYVGFGGPRFVLSLTPVDPAPNKGFFVINTVDLASAEAIVPRLREKFSSSYSDMNTRVTRMFLGPEDPAVIQLQVVGPDADYINAKAEEVATAMANIDGMIEVWSDWRGQETDLALDVDQQAARVAGVTSADISSSLTRHLDGEMVSMYRDGDEMYPIMLRAREEERSSIDRLRTVAVYSQNGSSVPLGQVAEVEMDSQWGFIQREDLVRTVTIEGRHLTKSPEDLVPIIQPELDRINADLAPGHEVKIAGILEESVQTNEALAAIMPLVFGLIFFMLIAQFGDYKRPLVIILALPFVFTGAFAGLLIMGSTFGFMAILSLYGLIGIIVNNSIVLVDRCDIEINAVEQREGDDAESLPDDYDPREARFEAVVKACRRRFRPVVMATLTTIAGLLPLIIFQDVLFYGFASSIAFGLLLGTPLVSLGMTPVIYALMFKISDPDAEADAESPKRANPYAKFIPSLPFGARSKPA